MDSFSLLTSAVVDRVAELKQMMRMRLDEGSKDLFAQDLQGLDASVRALENQMSILKAWIRREQSSIHKAEALIEATKSQNEHLNAIASNLPARLPRSAASSVQGVLVPVAGSHGNRTDGAAAGTQPSAAVEDAGRRRKEAPRCYVTEAELQSVSSYMRGRLQLDKVNAAVDELAGHAAMNAKLMAAARGAGGKLAPADRKRATDLLHSVAVKEGVKGHFWFLESDLKEGTLVKLDKSGKNMLTLLRHLGRLQEVRCSMDGTAVLVYVLLEEVRRHG